MVGHALAPYICTHDHVSVSPRLIAMELDALGFMLTYGGLNIVGM